MALDSKTIKEEILDKDIYEANAIRAKGRTPDSPESVRAVAPRSPISPKAQYTSLALQRTANGSTSPPIQKGGSTSPPQTSSAPSIPQAATPILLTDTSKELSKLRKFLGALYQFGQDTSTECGDRVRSLILSLVSGGLSTEAFKQALQESVNFPLRPYVLPFLKSHVPVLKRDLANLAKASNQSILQYIRSNEASVFEFVNTSAENTSSDIFMPNEGAKNGSDRHQPLNGNSRLLLKRRTSEGIYDHQNGPPHEWSDYLHQSKRSHIMMNTSAANGHLFTNYPSLFDYSTAPASHLEPFTNSLDKNIVREERDMRSSNNGSATGTSATIPSTSSDVHRNNGSVGSSGSSAAASTVVANRGEEEWKNIHTMLNCISAMVDKTKRAITILQQRGVESSSGGSQTNQQHADTSIAEIKRQTEEKVAEFRRNAEEAVNQVKRQAVIEIQRAVAAAETRAIEAMAQERIKLEKMFADYHKSATEESAERLTPPSIGTQNTCWNCGRKANETCSGCNLARYCGSFCQHKDWEQHHQVCGTTVRIDVNGHKHTTARNPTGKIPSTRSSSPMAVQTQPSQSSSAAAAAAAAAAAVAAASQSSSNSITSATVK
ncbi:protein CBFA2T2 isoform X2 [Contarinia nasturtii]|nr:protein CBFA2T2 isoform X2 [Contarinia nasturtii]